MIKQLLASASLTVLCGATAAAAEFQAQLNYTAQGAAQTMQLYVKGDRYRIERTADGQHVTVLVDRKRHIVEAWGAGEHEYHETSTSNPLAGLYDPFEAVGMLAAMTGGGMRQKPAGTEEISGFQCDKYAVTSTTGSVLLAYTWVARDLGFPLKIVMPSEGGMHLLATDVRQTALADSLFSVPPGYAYVPEPGETPPPWSADVASAPLVALPFQRVMSAGEIVRVRLENGQTIEVAGSQSAAKRTQISAVPFAGGKPAENIMPDTFNFGPGETWTVTVGPAPAGRELVVRVNTGRALVTVRRKP